MHKVMRVLDFCLDSECFASLAEIDDYFNGDIYVPVGCQAPRKLVRELFAASSSE